MSKMAQELQRQIDELQKQSRIKHRRPTVTDEQQPASDVETAADGEQDGTPVEIVIEVVEDVTSGEGCIAPSNDDTMRVLADDPSDTQQQQEETDMATETHGKKRSHHKKPATTAKAAKPKAPKKTKATKPAKSPKKAASKAKATTAKPKRAKAPKREAGASTGRQHKSYSLVDGIPDSLRNPSAVRSIFETIQRLGRATIADIRAAHPGCPDGTIRCYLGKFQLSGVLTSSV